MLATWTPNLMTGVQIITYFSENKKKSRYVFSVSGAIFEQGAEEIQSAFKYAINVHNENISVARFKVVAQVDIINTADAFKLGRISK